MAARPSSEGGDSEGSGRAGRRGLGEWAWGYLTDPPEGRGVFRDILAEERLRPRGAVGLWRPWTWVRWALCGYAVLAGCAVLAVVWLAVTVLGGSAGNPNYAAYVGRMDAAGGGRVAEAGRELTPWERELAGRYGEPLHLGAGGLPMVEHGVTGERRELTPLEMEFDEDRGYQELEDGRVRFSPGPRGWGLWWPHQDEWAEPAPLSFDRSGWRRQQERELRVGLGYVLTGLDIIQEYEAEPWRRGVSALLWQQVRAFEQRHYAASRSGRWAELPARWQCDEELERALTEGVTAGCPQRALNLALERVWRLLGQISDHYHFLAQAGMELDRQTVRERQRGLLLGYVGDRLEQLAGDLEELVVAVAVVEVVSREEGVLILLSAGLVDAAEGLAGEGG